MSNTRTILDKADMTSAALAANGGLRTDQAMTFIRGLQDMPTLLRQMRVVDMPSSKYTINKIGIGTRALHGATDQVVGTYLADAKRTVPTTSKIELNSKEVMAEVHIPYNVFEDNVEGDNLEATILALLMDRVAIDLEELAINGDTTIDSATDDLLCKCDGLLKRATSHVIDKTATPVAISLDPFSLMMKAMPNKYLRERQRMGFFVSPHAQIDYAAWLAARETGGGDARIIGDYEGIPALGSAIRGVATMGNTKALFMNPLNGVLGIQRDISLEYDRDVRARVFIFVLTLRVDVQMEETDAAVKFLGLNVT